VSSGKLTAKPDPGSRARNDAFARSLSLGLPRLSSAIKLKVRLPINDRAADWRWRSARSSTVLSYLTIMPSSAATFPRPTLPRPTPRLGEDPEW